MTKEQIEQAIDEHLDSITFDEEGRGIMSDGRIATEADFVEANAECRRLKKLLRSAP